MILFKSYFFVIFLYISSLANYIDDFESQSNIIFKKNYINKKANQLELKVDFNTAVLYLEQKKYFNAIRLFKKTSKNLKVPSFLNIGIAYYKLKSNNNAYLYLKKLYNLKSLYKQDLYSYVSASYYLYQITNDRKYLSSILKSIKQTKTVLINEQVKLLVVNTYIILKKYKKAIKLLKTIENYDKLKLALLYLKTKNYVQSDIYLQKVLNDVRDDNKINNLLWLKVFVALKANDLAKIKDNIENIDNRIDIFKQYTKMPLKIYFNKNKFIPNEIFNSVNKISINRKIDILFYFVPYIFSDSKKIKENSTFAFVLKNKIKKDELSQMLEYNTLFRQIVKNDPIIRVDKLQKIINKKQKINAYEYYNLALSYAQIFNYKDAYYYFNKAYQLDKANKLFSSLTLISSKQADIKISKKDKSLLLANLQSKSGSNIYLGQYLYKLIFKNNYKLNKKYLFDDVKNTTFYRSLEFLEYYNSKDKNKHDMLLYKDVKDPLVFLFKALNREKNENDYNYISRLQDYIPKYFNDYFVQGPLIITDFYIDILRGLGVFDKVDFKIKNNKSPSYLRTKALINLYDGYGISSIKTLENLQDKYKLNDKYTYNLLVASYLSTNDYANSLATLGELQFKLKDKDASFLNAVVLLNELKLSSSKVLFQKKYSGKLIDFKLEGLDEYLENL